MKLTAYGGPELGIVPSQYMYKQKSLMLIALP